MVEGSLHTFYILVLYLSGNFIPSGSESQMIHLETPQKDVTDEPLTCFESATNNFLPCADHCLMNTNCSSVLYNKRSGLCNEYAETSTALHTGGKKLTTVMLIDIGEYKLIRSKHPCRDKPCQPNQRCVPNQSSYTCQDMDYDCTNILVTGFFSTPTDRISASSVSPDTELGKIRLFSNGGWKPLVHDQNQYAQVMFEALERISGVVTRGAYDTNNWVTSYKVSYSVNCSDFEYILDRSGDHKIFPGNVNDKDRKSNFFEKTYRVLCVRIHPWTFTGVIGLRMDIYGCCNPKPDGVQTRYME